MSASPVSWLGYPARVRAATAILVLISLFTLGRLMERALIFNGFERPYARWGVERFRTLRAELPHVRSVGYVTDTGPLRKSELRMDNPDAKDVLREYFVVRYVLAPTIVTYGATEDYVVGNLSASSAAAALGRILDLDIVRDYGNGAVLFRRHTP